MTGLSGSPAGRTSRHGTSVLVEGADVPRLKALIRLAVRASASVNGAGPSADVSRMQRVVDEACVVLMAEVGHADVRDEAGLSPSGLVSQTEIEVEEVARMTGLSTRQARRLVSTIGGRKTRSGTWLINPALVEAYLAEYGERPTLATTNHRAESE